MKSPRFVLWWRSQANPVIRCYQDTQYAYYCNIYLFCFFFTYLPAKSCESHSLRYNRILICSVLKSIQYHRAKYHNITLY